MTKKQAEETLKIAKNLKFRIDTEGHLRAFVSASNGEFITSPEIVVLLQLIAQKCKKQELHAKLKQVWQKIGENLPSPKEIEELLIDMQEARVLVHPKANIFDGTLDGFGDPWIQWAMLADTPRTQSYLKALKHVVNSETHILDLGAGTGIFSAFALENGAASAIAIEETSTALVAKDMLKPYGQKAKIFAANSADVALPYNINLVVSELFGNNPFQEGVLPTLREVASRLNLKKTQFIPQKLEIFVEAIDVRGGVLFHRLEAFVRTHALQQPKDFLETFRKNCLKTLDFSSLSFPFPQTPDTFVRISDPVSLGCINLAPPAKDLQFFGQKKLSVQANRAEPCVPVVLMWFRVTLIETPENITLSSHPLEPDYAPHWSPLAIPLRQTPSTPLTCTFNLDENETFLSLEIDECGVCVGKL